MKHGRRSGQITVLALLLGLLGLTVGLSVASRSLSDLKQVSYVDSGIRAYAAAEAGLQEGLYQVSQSGSNANCQSHFVNSALPTGIASLSYIVCGNSRDFATQTVGKDEVFQLIFPASIPGNLKSADVVWKDNSASMEVLVLDQSFGLTRYVIKGRTATIPTTAPLTAVVGSTCVNSLCADASYNSGSCSGVGVIVNIDQALLIRVKPIMQSGSTDVAICGRTAGNSPGRLTTQFIAATASATTTNGTVKKLEATQTPAALPSVFDNVLFSAGDITK